MNTINVEIINPKAKKLLNDLEERKLIRIEKNYSPSDFIQFVKQLRKKAKRVPSLEEITGDVEIVRSKRYALRKNKGNH
ncbi:MAG TPA: hypothetical protein VE978_03025 [Chitinophagales bacterium]|nr:hypothetical protein [Chitinophagales bacterium]